MKRTLPHWLPYQARTNPKSPALAFQGREWTYSQLYFGVRSVAALLRDKGIDHGTRVAVLSTNHPTQIMIYHALILLGAVIVPVNYKLTQEEIRWQLDNAGCRYLCYHEDLESKIPADILPGEMIPFSATEPPGSAPPEPDGLRSEVTLEDICTLFYTSGTTGKPKGVTLTYRNFFMSAMASALNMGLSPGDNWLACLPLDHMGGFSILMRSVIYGTTMTLCEQFDPRTVREHLAESGATLLSLVPTMLERLLSGEASPAHQLRAVLLGGGPAPPGLTERARRQGIPVLRSYGMTETCSQIVTAPLRDPDTPPAASGKVLPFSSIKILNTKGAECPAGVTGEIVVSGPTIMEGYWRNPTATNSTIIQGWLHTGDYGHLDDAGYLYVEARREDLIVTGGENVSPEEVETVIRRTPGVQDVCVVGIPDPHWGEAVSAAVVPEPGAELDAGILRSTRYDDLAPFKHPKHYLIVKAIPKTALGKPERYKLRRLLTDSIGASH